MNSTSTDSGASSMAQQAEYQYGQSGLMRAIRKGDRALISEAVVTR